MRRQHLAIRLDLVERITVPSTPAFKLGRDIQIVVKAMPRSRNDGRLSIVFA